MLWSRFRQRNIFEKILNRRRSGCCGRNFVNEIYSTKHWMGAVVGAVVEISSTKYIWKNIEWARLWELWSGFCKRNIFGKILNGRRSGYCGRDFVKEIYLKKYQMGCCGRDLVNEIYLTKILNGCGSGCCDRDFVNEIYLKKYLMGAVVGIVVGISSTKYICKNIECGPYWVLWSRFCQGNIFEKILNGVLWSGFYKRNIFDKNIEWAR